MPETVTKRPWRFGKRDAIALMFVVIVIIILSLGSKERRTAATPDDTVHRNVASRTECMSCHGADGVRPQPKGHTRADQCFQCHLQPPGWKGGKS
jgi:hypothetical protein